MNNETTADHDIKAKAKNNNSKIRNPDLPVSIVEEISNYPNAIVNENVNDTVKSKGYLLSLNRMFGYQLTNIQNVHFFEAKTMLF